MIEIGIDEKNKVDKFDERNRGRRVELVYTDDQYTGLKSGDKGTYEYAMVNGELIQHSIKWDSGSSLMLVGGHDRFKFIDKLCPKCGNILKTVLFLGIEPDFLACNKCHIAYDLETLKPLATIF